MTTKLFWILMVLLGLPFLIILITRPSTDLFWILTAFLWLPFLITVLIKPPLIIRWGPEKLKTCQVGILLFIILLIFFYFIGYTTSSRPKISISEPKYDSIINRPTSTIRGTVTPGGTTVSVYMFISGTQKTKIYFVNKSGNEFSFPVNLIDGQNLFAIVAENQNGGKTTTLSLRLKRVLTDEEKKTEDERNKKIIEERRKAEESKRAKEKAAQAKWERSKAGQICGRHPTWANEDCTRLADKKIWVGMDYEMLVYLRGKPNNTNVSNYGRGNQYQYCWYNYTPSCFYDDDGDGKLDAYN